MSDTDHVDEPVHLSDYDPSWPAMAARLKAHLLSLLQDFEAQVEHIGSTSVPGMRSKPIIDLLIGVSSEGDLSTAARRLANAGWTDLGEAGVPGRRYLRQRTEQPANAHIVVRNGEHWTTNIALRDFLRMHPNEATAYAREKERALTEGAAMLLPYSQQKAPFMTEMIGKARRWASG